MDCVGGATLADVLSTLNYGGAVAASGLAGGVALNTTVMPFILRGVPARHRLGADADRTRRELWRKLGAELKPRRLPRSPTRASLDDIPRIAEKLRRNYSGRAVVRMAGVS